MIFLQNVSSESLPKIYVDPPENTANQGDTLVINVRIENARDVWVFQFYLAWKTGLLEATEVVEGDFPGRGGVRKTSFIHKVYNDRGYLTVSTTLVGEPREGEDGSGTLATITFSIKDAGLTGLHLYDVGLADSFLEPIEYTVEDGYLNVAAPKLQIVPPNILDATLVPGEEFTINLTISNVENLTAFRLQLGYDITLLNATKVSVTPFLKEPITPEVPAGINFTEGFVWINVTSMGEPITGNKVLANITFSILDVGSTILDIYNAFLDDKLAKLRTPSFQHNPISEDGYFSNIPAGHDIIIKKITVLPIEVTSGQTVSVNVTVMNVGAFNETFDVTLYYDSKVIEVKSNISLEPGESKVLMFTWDTTGVSGGSYILKAEASVVEGETRIGNNVKEFPGLIDVKSRTVFDFTLYLGIGVTAIIAVLAAVVYFLKFRKPK
jgi:hypothetical protein